MLTLADTVHRVFGPRTMTAAAKGLHALGLPQWLPSMPRAYRMPETLRTASAPEPDKVVYFPSCINQTMGLARETPVAEPLAEKMVALLRKAGYEVVFPENMERLCCGTIWESKGMADIADRKTAELEEALAGAVRPEPLPVPHARKDRPHETLRTGGVHLDLPARPAGVPALSPCMSPARCAAWGCPG